MAALPAVGGDSIEPRLEVARRELLDLGLRNSLLNYRPLRSRGAAIVDESPVELFRLLVTQERKLSFLPAPEPSPQTALALPQPELEPPLADEPAAPTVTPASQTDSRLQTPYPSEQLQARLLATHYAARTFVEEQGVNILYLALGMLEWFEADAAQEPRRAPLVLVPVELERADARQRFQLRYTGEELGENLSLRAKLEADFRVRAPPLPEVEDFDIAAYFDAWTAAIDGLARWQVDRTAVALGFFSFGKFLMFRDLDVNTWPAHAQPGRHPILHALLADAGFQQPVSEFADNAFLDNVAPQAGAQQVVDADSSQTLTILDVKAGRNLIVQGPPGTGKSQTITNIIAEAIGDGQKVLFVAEKMAALEVVKRRLDGVGLGDACLELHSHKINKRSVLAELQRTLNLGRPRVAGAESDLATLDADRARLNAYAEAVNAPVGETGLTPYAAYGELVTARQDAESANWPRCELPVMADWPAADANRRLAMLQELQARVARMGVPAQHPFWGARLAMLLPTEPPRIRATLDDAAQSYAPLLDAATALATALGLAPPADKAATAQLLRVAQRVLQAPELNGLQLDAPEWHSQRAPLDALLTAGARADELRRQHAETLLPAAWDTDVAPIRADLNAHGRAFLRFLSGAYRSAKRGLAALCVAAPPDGLDTQLALLDDISAEQQQRALVGANAALGARLFGPRWQAGQPDWAQLRTLSDWLGTLHADIAAGELPPGVIAALGRATSPDLARLADALDAANMEWDTRLHALLHALDFEPGFRERPYAAQQTALASWSAHFANLDQIAAFNASAQDCRTEGLGELVELAANWPLAGTTLVAAVRRGRATLVLERAFRERPALAGFEGSSHEQVIARFRELDRLALEHNRARLALAHWSSVPKTEGGGQYGVLRREFEKRSRHLPIRRLMERAGNAIQAIKPVFMMSPLSIATYLPPGALAFDLVVFDEASQVRPVDAFGALLRGAQAVVVGDDKQLPPTRFFDSLSAADDESTVDVDYATAENESILNVFRKANAARRMLRWHYRSQHQSLIAVSNHQFYEDKLVVFPSPGDDNGNLGLRFHHLPETSYGRGSTRSNDGEAQAVAEAVIQHAKMSPELTLGVAAFSSSQAQAVLDKLEMLRCGYPVVERFFADHPSEPFFVKNLENVQGDERDVILISVGYGKDASGYLSMNFGPLNAEGGERRLNVLITRARQRCEVFTNLTADDIDTERASGEGVKALKVFLKYAQTGILDVPLVSDRPSGSPFEDAVADALRGAGYEVDGQVGSAGFFIDLAVKDPARPGRYLLGIECDGATYHSAQSARDRDRLRQQVLEGLGWRIARVWSTDWFRNPERELRRLAATLESAKAAGGAASTPVSAAPAVTAIAREELAAPLAPSLPSYTLATPHVQTGGVELHLVPTATLAGWLCEVVTVESPVHRDEARRRVLAAAGVGRMGSRIQQAFNQAFLHAVRAGQLRAHEAFLWTPAMTAPPLRDRSTLHGASRDLALIAPEEIELAITRVVRDAYGIETSQIAPAVARLFGFQRLTDDMRAQIDPLVERMVADGRLTRQGEQVAVVG